MKTEASTEAPTAAPAAPTCFSWSSTVQRLKQDQTEEFVPLLDVKIGDKIKCVIDGKTSFCPVLDATHVEPPSTLVEFLQVCFDEQCNEKITLSSSHLLCVVPEGARFSNCTWPPASMVKPGDYVLSGSLVPKKVSKVEQKALPGFVAMLTNSHAPIVDGVVASDFSHFWACEPLECHKYLSVIVAPIVHDALQKLDDAPRTPLLNGTRPFHPRAAKLLRFASQIMNDGCVVDKQAMGEEITTLLKNGKIKAVDDAFIYRTLINYGRCPSEPA